MKSNHDNLHFLVYWPQEESVSVVKKSDIIAPFSNKFKEEVKVKVGCRVISGILKFSGSISDVRKAEKEMCQGYEEISDIPKPSKPSKKCSRGIQSKEKSKAAKKGEKGSYNFHSSL